MNYLCTILIILLSSTASFGAVIYDNSNLTNATSSIGTPPNHILFDDVLVPSSRDPLHLPLAITRITVLISAFPGASGQFSVWNFPVQGDGSPSLPPTLIDSTQVTFTNAIEQVTFGNGSTTLFTVTPNFTAEPGFGLFFLGLQGSSAISGAGWMWADGPDINRATAYNYDVASNTIFLNSPVPGFPPHVSYYLRIEAAPEPAAWCLLATSLLLLMGFTSPSLRDSARRLRNMSMTLRHLG